MLFVFYVVVGYVYYVNNDNLMFCWFLNKIFLIKKIMLHSHPSHFTVFIAYLCFTSIHFVEYNSINQ